MRIRCGLVFLVLCGVLRAATYNVADLGTLGGATSIARGINASGQVVGYAATVGNAANDPVLFSPGSNIDLGTLGGTSGSAVAINSAGAIAGYATTAGNTATRAFVAFGGALVDIGTLGGASASAMAINDSGQIAGFADTGTTTRAFRYEKGKMTDLGTLAGGTFSYGYGINAAGRVVGLSSSTAGTRAFLHNGTAMTSLGVLASGNSSAAYAVNDHDQVVGYSNTVNGGADTHPFLYENGQMKDLGTLGGASGIAWAINNSGQIVGQAKASGDADHAFLCQGGQMTDLNDLIPANSGWVLADARAINDKGQIAGSGTINGQTHAFLLTKPGGGNGTQPPRIYINGGRRVVTGRPKARVEGSSGGDVSKVLYRLNNKGPWRKAHGDVSGWKVSVPLKSARTVFQAVAVGPTGAKSKPARLVIIHKEI